MAQRTNIVASAVPEHEIGIASSILTLARNIAGAFGISVFGTILSNSVTQHLFSLSESSSIHSTNPLAIRAGIALITLKAQITAYTSVFITSSVIVFVGALLALFSTIEREVTDVEVFVE